MSTEPLLYAEYLPNIHLTSLIVQLCEQADVTTAISVAEDQRTITLGHKGRHYGVTTRLPLIEDGPWSRLLPLYPSKTKSSRLKNAANHYVEDDITTSEQAWPAEQLQQYPGVACQTCRARGRDMSNDCFILSRSVVRVFKNLPSQGWAEMMDFWHCHKPDEDGHDGSHSAKGYSASSRLQATIGVGLVDAMTILVTPADCSNILGDKKEAFPGFHPTVTEQLRYNQPERNDELIWDPTGFYYVAEPDHHQLSRFTLLVQVSEYAVNCARCNAVVGEVDQACDGVRLFKPRLLLAKEGGNTSSPSLGQWFSSYLLPLGDYSGAKKFRARYLDFVIWVFSPLIWYSLSSSGGNPSPAMKIFYRSEGKKEMDDLPMLTATNACVDDLDLPEILEIMLHGELERSNQSLPGEMRRFQDWQVALLDRLGGSGAQEGS